MMQNPRTKPAPKDDALFSLELKIAKFLRYGVIVAGLLMAAGWLGQIRFDGNPFAAFETYHALPFFTAIGQAWAHRNVPELLAQAGLIALISLPLLRVLMTAVLFIKQKDFMLAAVAAFVLTVLVISSLLGLEL